MIGSGEAAKPIWKKKEFFPFLLLKSLDNSASHLYDYRILPYGNFCENKPILPGVFYVDEKVRRIYADH